MEDCRFLGNSASQGGGADIRDCPTDMIGCTFEENSASAGGSALFLVGTTALIMRNCRVQSNSSFEAIFNFATLHAINCTVSGNSGNGVLAQKGTLAMTNGTFDGQTGRSVVGPASASLLNCIVWDESPFGSSPSVQYSNVRGGYPGEGNTDADPMFVNAAQHDLRLQSGSPCIDAAHTCLLIQASVDDRDIDGQPRSADDPAATNTGVACWGRAADMGAHEFQPSGKAPTRPQDIAPAGGDGAVNVSDLIAVILAWGACP